MERPNIITLHISHLMRLIYSKMKRETIKEKKGHRDRSLYVNFEKKKDILL